MAALLSLTLLGGFSARVDAGPISFSSRKARALVAYLALQRGDRLSRDKVGALLWPGARPGESRDGLRQCLFQIRQLLAGHGVRALSMEPDTIALDPAAVDVDVAAFERLISRAGTEPLEQAMSLYRGPLLDGFRPREPEFEAWLLGERRRLAELASTGLARLLDRHVKAGAADRAIPVAFRLLDIDPLQEPAHRTLMRLCAETGWRDAALRQYERCADVLRRELGAEPDEETQLLYQDLVRHERALIEHRVGAPPGGFERRASSAVAAPFVGRELEIGRLRQELARARKGDGRVTFVPGEAGVGKTRLVEEAAAAALDDGWAVIVARSCESEQLMPFAVWARALRATAAPSHEAIATLEPGWRAALAGLLPRCADGAELPALGSGNERRLCDAIVRLVHAVADRRPLLIVLDDLHWADEPSVRMLAHLGRRLGGPPVLVLATARAEEIDPSSPVGGMLAELRQDGLLSEMALPRLSLPGTRSLVRGLAPGGIRDVDLSALADRAWRASAGNPFVAVEVVRALQEGTSPPVDEALSLPRRVRDLLLGRVERVGDLGRDLLNTAAVIGVDDFPFALLRHAADLDDRRAAAGLEELVRRGLAHAGGDGFHLLHEQVRDVVYEQLPPERRSLLHAAVGRALESLHAADLSAHHATLGWHYEKGRIWEPAAAHLRAAGVQAAARGAHRDAVALLERALAALAHPPDDGAAAEQAIDIRIALRDSLMALGEVDRIADHAREAERLASRIGDDRRLAIVCGHLAHHHWQMGEPDRAMESAHRAAAIARAVGDDALLMTARLHVGEAHHAQGDHAGALEWLRDSDPRMLGPMDGPRLVAVAARVAYASSLAALGRFPEARARLAEAIGAVEGTGHPRSLVCLQLCFGRILLEQGHVENAMPPLEHAMTLVEQYDVIAERVPAMSALGLARALSGHAGDGIALMERAVDGALPSARASVSRQLAEAYLAMGRLPEALTWATRALAHAERFGRRGDEAWAMLITADIAGAAPDPETDRALSLYDEAVALAEAGGMRPIVARCRLGAGRVLARAGDRVKAAEHLAAAVALARETDLGRWRQAAESELAALV